MRVSADTLARSHGWTHSARNRGAHLKRNTLVTHERSDVAFVRGTLRVSLRRCAKRLRIKQGEHAGPFCDAQRRGIELTATSELNRAVQRVE